MARGEAPRGKLLAVGPDIDQLPGADTRDPAFGGRAKWIAADLSHQAAVVGVTVVDRSAVVTTHLAEVVREHAGSLLSRQDTKVLLDVVKTSNPVLLEEMTAAGLTLGDIQGVLRGLLDERRPGARPGAHRRGGHRAGPHAAEGRRLPARSGAHHAWDRPSDRCTPPTARCPPSPSLPRSSTPSSRPSSPATGGGPSPSPQSSAEDVVRQLARISHDAEARGTVPVVLCSTRLRPALRRLLRPSLPRLAVVGAGEIGASLPVETIGSVNDEAVALN